MSVRLTLICHASTSAVREVAFPPTNRLIPKAMRRHRHLPGCCAGSMPHGRVRRCAPHKPPRRCNLRRRSIPRSGISTLVIGRAVRSLDVQESDPDGIAAWTSQSDAAPHGGESVIALLERISGWLDALKQEDGRIVAVTHPAVIRAAIVLGIDAKPISFWRIDIAPLCRVSIQGNASHWTLRSITPQSFDCNQARAP